MLNHYIKYHLGKSIGAVIVCIYMALTIAGCTNEDYSTNPNDKLSFSVDTLSLDTVFNQEAGPTARFMVYNRHSKALKIDKIALVGGSESIFRINVDGTLSNSNSFNELEIAAGDSMFVFVSAKANSLQSNQTLFFEDSIRFSLNGQNQHVKLQAYGQSVEVLRNKTIHNDTLLTAQKPYLIDGYLKIDSAKTLQIEAGAKFYFRSGAGIEINGNLIIEGTAEKPVIMRCARTDKMHFTTPVPYANVAGQWGGILLKWKYGKHRINYLHMSGGEAAIVLNNDDVLQLPELEIKNSRIHNFLSHNLWVRNANTKVENSEISNAGAYCVFLSGGTHNFTHATIVNFFTNSYIQPVSRQSNPALKILNMDRVAPMQTSFRNCIIDGTYSVELDIETRFENLFPTLFQNCYIKRNPPYELVQFKQVRYWEAKDSVFVSNKYDEKKKEYFNFMPAAKSPARNMADKEIARDYPYDLNGNNRFSDGSPDVGAYEGIEKKL